MPFLMNTWYCAGWSESLKTDQASSIKIVNQPLVLFRSQDGAPAALANLCPHRFAPLDRGRVCAGKIRCAYHGLVFDSTGACVENPHGNRSIPARAIVRSFPVVERHGALWVWMGDRAPDPHTIPDFSALDPDTTYAAHGYLYARANYQLDTDNILDLGHIQFLHGDTLGSNEISAAKLEVVQEGSTVWSRRRTTNEQLTPFLQNAFFVPADQRISRSLDVRWDPPASMLLVVTVRLEGETHADVRRIRNQCHIFTPETEHTSHYFFALAYPRSIGPFAKEMAEAGVAGLMKPFTTEDLPMLEAQQEMLGARDIMDMRPIMLESDAAGMRARRVLTNLIEQEIRQRQG